MKVACVNVQFLTAKTRVSPLGKVSIPRLELLSALLLSKLMITLCDALASELNLECPTCYSDSIVALCWIKNLSQDWKQFVDNQVTVIRSAVPAQHWKHCPGISNPADISSRGTAATKLIHNHLYMAQRTGLAARVSRSA